jgi:hypothetical protein
MCRRDHASAAKLRDPLAYRVEANAKLDISRQTASIVNDLHL